MADKQIIVLANSTKHYPMRCVAGRELLLDTPVVPRFGAWVRPVSTHDEGALNDRERLLPNRTEPVPLDIVEISLSKPEGNPLQPENWHIQQAAPWRKISTFNAETLRALVEEPTQLWWDPSKKSDRAGADFLRTLPALQSLYLIRPEGFQFQVRSRVWDGYAKKQLRGQFSYQGRYYDLAVTDPLIGGKYFPDFPRTPEGIIQPADSRKILLCVSLTPPFEGQHYKVVASVFELTT
jgi:hypothetical protein